MIIKIFSFRNLPFGRRDDIGNGARNAMGDRMEFYCLLTDTLSFALMTSSLVEIMFLLFYIRGVMGTKNILSTLNLSFFLF